MTERDFKGVWIPKTLYLDQTLSWTEKILLVEVDSLDNDEQRGCFASNKHLADFLQKSEGTVGNLVCDLKKKGWLTEVYNNGRSRGLRIKPSETCFHEKVKPSSRKREDSNTEREDSLLRKDPASSPQIERCSIFNDLIPLLEEEGNTPVAARKMIGSLLSKHGKHYVFAIFEENRELILGAESPFPYLKKILVEQENTTPAERLAEQQLREAKRYHIALHANLEHIPDFDPAKYVSRFPLIAKFIDKNE